MGNFREKLRSFLYIELNNLINERCKEKLTDDIVIDAYHRCNNEITKQSFKEIVEKNFKEDIVNKFTFHGTSLDFY